ncbi:MAG: L-histidine N(alpha)-methyltransferase [Oligoflexus sp.]
MNSVNFIDLKPDADHFLEDVWNGLSKQPKQLFPKYFYDQKGSQLFDQICHLDEYYPTRTEMAILEQYSEDIDQELDVKTMLIEFGSGSSIKIRKLLDQSSKIYAYLPIDISKDHLQQAAEKINQFYPKLQVTAICADYTKMRDFPDFPEEKGLTRAVFFPGSTIGNLSKSEAITLLQNTRNWIGNGGILIIGFDLIKDKQVLINAYDDSKGVTAAFNFNLLERINRELNGNFQIKQFRHEARFNEAESRIEMHLVSMVDQTVEVGDRQFFFEKGESIHTESSRKFLVPEFDNMAKQAGFRMLRTFTDGQERFAVCMLKADQV